MDLPISIFTLVDMVIGTKTYNAELVVSQHSLECILQVEVSSIPDISKAYKMLFVVFTGYAYSIEFTTIV